MCVSVRQRAVGAGGWASRFVAERQCVCMSVLCVCVCVCVRTCVGVCMCVSVTEEEREDGGRGEEC